jgi:hypothetical protein
MSTTVPPTLAIPIKTRWLNNKAAVEVILGAPEDPRLMEALARDQPPTHDVELGTIAARAHVETDAIEFAGKGGSVRFRSEASAHAGVGLFMRGERLLNALGFDEEMGGRVAVELPPDPEDEDYYAALHWGTTSVPRPMARSRSVRRGRSRSGRSWIARGSSRSRVVSAPTRA